MVRSRDKFRRRAGYRNVVAQAICGRGPAEGAFGDCADSRFYQRRRHFLGDGRIGHRYRRHVHRDLLGSKEDGNACARDAGRLDARRYSSPGITIRGRHLERRQTRSHD